MTNSWPSPLSEDLIGCKVLPVVPVKEHHPRQAGHTPSLLPPCILNLPQTPPLASPSDRLARPAWSTGEFTRRKTQTQHMITLWQFAEVAQLLTVGDLRLILCYQAGATALKTCTVNVTWVPFLLSDNRKFRKTSPNCIFTQWRCVNCVLLTPIIYQMAKKKITAQATFVPHTCK